MKPIIGITMGDPAGIGSEIIVKALNQPDVYETCRPVVIGSKWAIEDAVKMTGIKIDIRGTDTISGASFTHGTIDIYDLDNLKHEKIPYGKVDADCGKW